MSELLINLSALMDKPTGISVYTQNVALSFQELNPILFRVHPTLGLRFEQIPQGLSPEFGFRGHFKRLWWLQNSLPKYYHQFDRGLIFSPLPEAPLYSNCRFVVTVHDIIPLRFASQFSWQLVSYFRHYVSRVVEQAEHIICDSVCTARDLVEFYKVPESKLTPILLAYDAGHFKPCKQDAKNYFLYLGRQDPHKNLSRLINAFQKVHQYNKDLELWLVGPTDNRYTPKLIEQVKAVGLEHKVRFLDYVAYGDLPKLIGEAISLVFPSLWEGFGLPPLEAMACGTPVITSNLSSLPEVVGDAAILIDPYNVNQLADAMRALANDSKLRQQLKQAGIERAEKFSWEKTGQQTAKVLKRFI